MTNKVDVIEIIGAKEHNLKNVDLQIPRNKMVVITGVSGSGKSSLAFDTIYAEGLRRYMETLSSYARQFIGQMERPDVEQISGLSPVISIEQKTTNKNPRSTVGTVTEIYDFMRLLFARTAEAYSYVTGKKMVRYTEEQIIEHIYNHFPEKKITLLAPLIKGRKGHYRELFEQIRKQGYNKVRIDGELKDISANMQVDRFKIHDIEVVVDRFTVNEERKTRIAESIQAALKAGNGVLMLLDMDTDKTTQYSKHLMCEDSGISYEEPSPNTFSFNSPYGSCPHCKGLGEMPEVDMNRVIPDYEKSINEIGIVPFGEVRENFVFTQLRALAKKYKFTFDTRIKDIPEEALQMILIGGSESIVKPPMQNMDYSYDIGKEGIVPLLKRWYTETTSEKIREWANDFMVISTCPECNGTRLKKESLYFKVGGKNIAELSEMDINILEEWFDNIEKDLTSRQLIIGKDVINEIIMRIRFLQHVGLNYLNLNRPARTLSGGETQRIRLATQIGSQLTGVTYILDEPSIGLHQRDNQKLIETLHQLAAIGNTVLVVEHDKDIMLAADYLIDIGPGAGKNGGSIVGAGIPTDFIKNKSITAEFLNNSRRIEIPKARRTGNGKTLSLSGASGNNLKNVQIEIPLGTFCCITGVSGSGKSTLINETLYPILRQHFYNSIKKPMPYKNVAGLEHLDKVIEIDQSPIGRTPRSNPATYTGVFNDIRKIFSELPESKIRGYKPGRFSFNVKGGRCEVCEGAGRRVIEMNFLPDVEVDCETCNGRRFNRETLEVLYKGKSISDVLEMTVSEAVGFFEPIPSIFRKVRTLDEVGLGYITLGQQATTLSGGEAQRVKLAEELSKRDTGNTIYILDEPTTGLHFQDIQHLLNVLYKLVEKGNTVVVIEHNMDMIKVADYIIDMGPEGGRGGGIVVGTGTPEQIAKLKKSHTGYYLKSELK
ncbi:MAG: excinuclease ABC subunit UvrA [Saprospiraceae bacterium]